MLCRWVGKNATFYIRGPNPHELVVHAKYFFCLAGTSRNSSIHDVILLDVFSFVIEQTTSMTKSDRFVIGLHRQSSDTTQP